MRYTEIFATNMTNNLPLPGATVSVWLTGTVTLATLFNAAGGALTNPMTADANGLVAFAVADGTYDVQWSLGSYVAPKIIKFQIFDDLTYKTSADVALAAEATTRGNADTALGSSISAEATTRGNADTALGSSISAEATTRGNADTALGSSISATNVSLSAEATTRAAADIFLGGAVSQDEGNYDFCVRDGSDNVIFGILGEEVLSATDLSGGGEAPTPVGGLEERPLLDSVTGRTITQVWARRSNGAYTAVTNGPFSASLVDDSVPGVVTIFRQGVLHDVKYRVTPIGAVTRTLPRKLRLVLVVGQSLAQGHTDSNQEALPPWRGNVHERAWMFDSSAFDGIDRGPRVLQVAPIQGNRDVVVDSVQFTKVVPLHGNTHAWDGNRAQTSAESMAAALAGQHLHWEDHLLCCVIGTGSTEIAKFLPGTPDTAHMQSCKKAISGAKAWVDKINADNPGCMSLELILVWNQGEQDNTIGTVQATYVSRWITIRDALKAYVEGLSGVYVGALIQQTMDRFGGSTGMATLAHAQLIRGGYAVGVSVPPMHPGYSGTLIHLKPFTYLPLGSQSAYGAAKLLEDPTYNSPFVADGDAHIIDGTHIDCIFSKGDGSVMVFDTETMANAADGWYGASATDAGGSTVAISNMVWTGPQTLRFTLASTTGVTINFGLTADARVNIRDSSAWPCGSCDNAQIISGWVPAHRVAAV